MINLLQLIHRLGMGLIHFWYGLHPQPGLPCWTYPRPWMVLVSQGGIGAEIGVYAGDHALQIIRSLRPRHLYAVDPYSEYVGNIQFNLDIARETAAKRLIKYSMVTRIFTSGQDWMKFQPSESLDWVYIDGAHDYDSVLADITAAYRIVVWGGIIAGHDIQHPPVARAVADFVAKEQPVGYRILYPDFAIKKG